jgi:hypothetical protein
MRRSRGVVGREELRNLVMDFQSSSDDSSDSDYDGPRLPVPPKRRRFSSSSEDDDDSEPNNKENFPIVSKGLGARLYEKMLAEEDVDVDILIGPQRKCVKGHKLVLAGGLSDVLITQLNAPLWKISEKDGKVIEFPEDISEEAALIFIKVSQSSINFSNINFFSSFSFFTLKIYSLLDFPPKYC